MGVDPGLQFTGVGVICVNEGQITHLTHQVIASPARLETAEKLHFLEEAISRILGEFSPQVLSLEKAFFGKNADSAFKLGLVRGVVMSTAAKNKTRVLEFAARSVKKGITGHGAADKETVALFVTRQLQIHSSARADATDALALALFAANYCDKEKLLSTRGIEI